MSAVELLYEGLMVPASILAAPFFALHPRGRERLAERYGAWSLPESHYLWFHGASAGEVRGLLPIVKALRAALDACDEDRCRTLLTVTSVTGLAAAGDEVDVGRLLPFDCGLWLARALRGSRVRAFVAGETELWPSLYRALDRRGAPIFLVNARISDFSYPRYRRLRFLLRPVLERVGTICTGDELSASRFVELGAPADRVHFLGNAKYDTPPPAEDAAAIREFRERFWPGAAPVLVLGSVRPGEEGPWLDAVKSAHDAGRELHLIVAPRHREKFQYFADALGSRGFPFRRYSEEKEGRGPRGDAPVVLLDTFGDLAKVYAIADLAFIGATMVNVGGHNPLEASIYRRCVAVGEYTQNIREVVGDLSGAGAVFVVRDAADVGRCVEVLLRDPERIRMMGEAGYSVWRKHSGAGGRIAARILGDLGIARAGRG